MNRCPSRRSTSGAAVVAPTTPIYRPTGEFRAAIIGYLEWGTRIAMSNSQPGAVTTAHAPVPRWGWGVAPPYQPSPGPHRKT